MIVDQHDVERICARVDARGADLLEAGVDVGEIMRVVGQARGSVPAPHAAAAHVSEDHANARRAHQEEGDLAKILQCLWFFCHSLYDFVEFLGNFSCDWGRVHRDFHGLPHGLLSRPSSRPYLRAVLRVRHRRSLWILRNIVRACVLVLRLRAYLLLAR